MRAERDYELRPEMLAPLRLSGLVQITPIPLLSAHDFIRRQKAGRARFEHTVGRAHSVVRDLPAIQISPVP
ncbi:hypothetical protein JCM18750_05110 [Halostagnicola bangensis]